MSDEKVLFKPDTEEPDPKSKVSYLEHISYRLKLPVPLKCESEKGLLSTNELRELAKEIAFIVDGAKLDDESVGSYQLGLKTRYDQSDDQKFKFLHNRNWNDFSKPQLAQVISLLLRFQLITKEEVSADDNHGFHIGESNGAIYLPFYKEIYHRLPHPSLGSEEDFELSKESISQRELKRFPDKKKISELIDMHKDPSKDGTMVPEFQRDNTQWSIGNRQLMIDSIMHNIPMPALVLGKSEDRPDDPWQIIDGHQRLTTMLFFVDDENKEYFPVFSGEFYHSLPAWARDRFDNYEFTVEKVIAKSDHLLSSLYERYNDSGKKMTQPQIRVALFHEISALHHYLLSMAGGPLLAKRPKARVRLGIHDNIDYRANRASALRSLLPTTSKPRPDERLQLRKVTERIYDLWCRIVGYCNYRKLEGNRTEFPTAKEAINTVFHHFRHGSTANQIVEQLDYIIRECATLYGDHAFCSMKALIDPDDPDKTVWEIRKSTHGWAAQVQCAGIWSLSDVDLSLLAHNPDTFQDEWAEFCKAEIAQQRQNSKSIWAAQEKWQKKVLDIISSINSRHLEEEDSPKRKQLFAAVELALSLDAAGRKAVMSMWELEKSPEEYEFLMKELDEMS